jgi:RNA polymerase sigma factor (TIGR02999 family)
MTVARRPGNALLFMDRFSSLFTGRLQVVLQSETKNLIPLLLQAGHGDASAGAKLAAIVWDGLHRLAEPFLDRHTFPPAELVDDVWQRLTDGEHVPPECHHRFQLIAARAMRRILSDETPRASTDNGRAAQPLLNMMRLDAALKELGRIDERKARIVELRYFAGLSTEEAAAALGMAPADASEAWQEGRAWICKQLRHGPTDRRPAAAA